MAGGRRVLRSTTNDAEGSPQRQSPGTEPGHAPDDTARAADLSGAALEDEMNAPTRPVPLRMRSSNTLRGSGPSGPTSTRDRSPEAATRQRTTATGANSVPVGGLSQDAGLLSTVQQLLDALNEAELAQAPADELAIRQKQFDRAVQTLALTRTGPAPGTNRPAFDEAGKIIRVLNNVQPKPKLGVESKPPTPQQVDQWIKDIDTAFQYAQVLEDSVTRTHWVMGTIQYGTHRELIQTRINEGSIRTWADLQAEEEQLVQDPVLTRYENYEKFFNFEWRDADSVNTFLMQLSRQESLLPHSFFKFEDGSNDHEFKIAFVWAKAPQTLKREIQRNGSLENLQQWADFERALRNAETATTIKPESKKTDTSGKRPANSPPRRKFKRQHSRGATPTRNESGKPPSTDRQQGGGQDNQRRDPKEGGYQKPHWKNRDNKQRDSGKGKP